MRTRFASFLIATATLLGACAMAIGSGLSPEQAAQHVGERATVCGTIASSHYAADVDGQPTFINLDKPYPDQVFTVVIWGDYRGKFSVPPEIWRGRVCITGRISTYQGEPQIEVTGPAQIQH